MDIPLFSVYFRGPPCGLGMFCSGGPVRQAGLVVTKIVRGGLTGLPGGFARPDGPAGCLGRWCVPDERLVFVAWQGRLIAALWSLRPSARARGGASRCGLAGGRVAPMIEPHRLKKAGAGGPRLAGSWAGGPFQKKGPLEKFWAGPAELNRAF